MTEDPPGIHPDHRARVGADRRARTRDLLIRTGLRLVASSGAFGFNIDEVTRSADVARGTFYKYYQSTEELVRDVAIELAEELIVTVNALVARESDPALRSGLGMRAVLRLAIGAPLVAAFITRAGWPHAATGHAFFRLVVPNLEQGMAMGRFRLADPRIGAMLVGGMTVGAMQLISEGEQPDDFPEAVAETLLVALGLDRAEAARLARLPFAPPAALPDGLIARSVRMAD